MNSVLFRRANIFSDVINVLFHVDLFFYHELKYRMEKNEILRDLFIDKLPKISEDSVDVRDTILIKLTSEKNNQNILLDWINIDKYSKYGHSLGMDITEFVANMYYDMLINPSCNEYIQPTEFGNTLRLLSKDINLNKIHVYLPFESDYLKESIVELFMGNSSKISIVIGDKKSLLSDSEIYDTFIFENCVDVDNCLTNSHSKLKEILIPAYEYNMIEDRTKLDRLIEQVTYRKLNLKEESSNYASKYNLSINTIGVPI